jgi:hypothetical protein
MTATAPVARVAPSRRLWIEISMTIDLSSRHFATPVPRRAEACPYA